MEPPCHKCGEIVEEGRVFCRQCGAPQIRVLVAEAAPAVPQVVAAGQSDILPSSETVPVLALPMKWSRALKSCGLAALIASALMFLGLHPFVTMPSAGFLAVVFYRQGQQNLSLKPGAAFRLGAFGGLLCFGLTALLVSVAAALPQSRAKLYEAILDSAQKLATTHPDKPQFQELLRQLQTPDSLVVLLIAAAIMLLIVSFVLGGLGGVIGGTMFRRRHHD